MATPSATHCQSGSFPAIAVVPRAEPFGCNVEEVTGVDFQHVGLRATQFYPALANANLQAVVVNPHLVLRPDVDQRFRNCVSTAICVSSASRTGVDIDSTLNELKPVCGRRALAETRGLGGSIDRRAVLAQCALQPPDWMVTPGKKTSPDRCRTSVDLHDTGHLPHRERLCNPASWARLARNKSRRCLRLKMLAATANRARKARIFCWRDRAAVTSRQWACTRARACDRRVSSTVSRSPAKRMSLPMSSISFPASVAYLVRDARCQS